MFEKPGVNVSIELLIPLFSVIIMLLESSLLNNSDVFTQVTAFI